MSTAERRRIRVGPDNEVGSVWCSPRKPRAAVALAHGAGNDMEHPFMQRAQTLLVELRCRCVRFNFPYKERGRRAPDRAPVLEAAWRAMLEALRADAPALPLVAAGKSLGGRIASRVAADGETLAGLIFFGYPLHPAGRGEQTRDQHFPALRMPTLFLQGSRDPLCDLDRLRRSMGALGGPGTLHVIEQADHSFNLPKRAGRSEAEVWAEIQQVVGRWLDAVL